MKKALSCHVPNRDEKLLMLLLSQHNLPYKFVGDGSLIIAGKNPDFVKATGEKKLIELFGEQWHEPNEEQERREFFEKYGYKTLVIWRAMLLKTPETAISLVEHFDRN